MRLATALLLICLSPIRATGTEPGADPLAMLGLRASAGAAPGYVPDLACQRCHPVKYESYQRVGMARSFKAPAQVAVIEDFDRGFYHEPSQRHYRIRRDGDEWVFRRHQLDQQGQPINVFETRIDWVLGSGNRARSYLYQTAAGELYQLPLGWYSETDSWGMSPGFEAANHPGVLRQVKRECLFCHNAYPEVPADSDWRWQEEVFPHDLPQGTGCQRCHGPGAAHIRVVLSGAGLEAIHGAIVNPRKLPPERRDSVCFQCHLLPAVAIIGARRFERPAYSFRPGELLSDYLVHVDLEEQGVAPEDRFEINHHGYRFWQSRCYRESRGELACISCHDPHVKPESSAFRSRVAGVCRDCHQDWTEHHEPTAADAESACVGCHMPTRRTRDVVLVTMTDHRIARGPFDAAALVKPLIRQEPIITGIELLPFARPPTGDTGELYRIVPVLRAYHDGGGARALGSLLDRSPYPSPTPYLDLLETQLKLGAFGAAKQTAGHVLEHHGELYRARTWLGLAQYEQGDNAEALASLEQSLALRPTPEAHYNLALAAVRLGRLDQAAEHLQAAIALRPTMHLAWKYRGQLAAARGDLDTARASLTRALEIEPADEQVYAALIDVLRRRGETEQAQRFLAVGRRVARDPGVLEKLDVAAP